MIERKGDVPDLDFAQLVEAKGNPNQHAATREKTPNPPQDLVDKGQASS